MSGYQVLALYATFETEEEARRIARTLVDERLVACANLFPKMVSVFRWDGQVQEANEVAMIAKTADFAAERALARLAALHSYDVPCATLLPVEAGLPDYLAWVRDEVS